MFLAGVGYIRLHLRRPDDSTLNSCSGKRASRVLRSAFCQAARKPRERDAENSRVESVRHGEKSHSQAAGTNSSARVE